jgi:acetoin utilization protein AcuB
MSAAKKKSKKVQSPSPKPRVGSAKKAPPVKKAAKKAAKKAPSKPVAKPRAKALAPKAKAKTTHLVREYMSPSPHTIGRDQTLFFAHSMMRDHKIRHLPVLDAAEIVGVVSQRDLYFVETLRDVDPRVVQIDDAMSQSVYSVSPDDSLESVAAVLAETKYGCALVVDKGKLVGIFTSVDATRALVSLLKKG